MKKNSGLNRRKAVISALSLCSNLCFMMMLLSLLSNDSYSCGLFWAACMVCMGLSEYLADKEKLYMMTAAVAGGLLLGLYLAIPAIPMEYNKVVTMTDIFLSMMIVVSFFHRFFENITTCVVTQIKNLLGMK